MARRDADLAAEAKKNGGDGILLKAEQTDFLGTYSTGNATGLAVLSALQIRLTESDVIDSRHVYPGHADIKLVINVPLGEPPPAEQVELIQECRKGPQNGPTMLRIQIQAQSDGTAASRAQTWLRSLGPSHSTLGALPDGSPASVRSRRASGRRSRLLPIN